MAKTKPYSRTDYLLSELSHIALTLGIVPGISHVHKFGKNPDISTTEEAVWNGGDDYTGHDPTAAETLDVVSTSTDDDSVTGEGAHTVELFGLDASWAEISEIVTLDGQVPVTTTKLFIRMNRAIVRSAGSLGWNVGAITADQSSSGDVMMVMPALYNQTMIAAYTVPAGKTAMLTRWFLSTAKKQAAYVTGRLMMRPTGETFQTKEELTVASTGTSSIERAYTPFKGPITAKTDIKIMAAASASGNAVNAGFDLILIDA